ncbi:MAG: TetR/AcrR family transcriptional regulator [Myxococcota bacterium]|nr:TetR/AcrR family transcriptional regulator [Myxococcota bacterium]
MSDGDATDRQQKKAESRRRILESARAIFFRDGFMAANLDEVAEKAGVAKGTLYRYFESKADLYVAVLADNGKVFTEKIALVVSGKGSAVEQIWDLANFYFDHWTRNPDYFQIFWAIDNQSVIGDLPGPVIDEVTRLWEQNLQILDRVLRQAVDQGELRDCDTWEVANILWTVANSIIQSEGTLARRKLRGRPLEDVFGTAIETLLRGLSATPAAASPGGDA